jgi:hypothetical protein
MRARRAKVFRAPPKDAGLLVVMMVTRTWLPRRHPSGGLRRLTWAETHPHRRTRGERLASVQRMRSAVWEQTSDGRWLVR